MYNKVNKRAKMHTKKQVKLLHKLDFSRNTKGNTSKKRKIGVVFFLINNSRIEFSPIGLVSVGVFSVIFLVKRIATLAEPLATVRVKN